MRPVLVSLLFPLLALVAPAVPAAAQDEAGFGGAGAEAAPDAPALDEDVCTVKGDDGVWRSCAEVVAAKARASAGDAEPEVVDPETKALRDRMRAADEAAQAPPPPAEKTQLEKDLEKARLDPTTPLLALRVDVARAEQRIQFLEKKGVGGKEKEEAVKALAFANVILADVERIALHRMDFCSQRRGNKPLFKNYRMTPAGPVLLTQGELMAQVPLVDPAGCERISLVDEKTVTRVKRLHELRKMLATRSFGYHEVAERRALERELEAVEAELAKDTVSVLAAPGLKDPY